MSLRSAFFLFHFIIKRRGFLSRRRLQEIGRRTVRAAATDFIGTEIRSITQQGSQFNSIERNIYSASRQCSNIYIIINFPLVFVYLVSHLDITI